MSEKSVLAGKQIQRNQHVHRYMQVFFHDNLKPVRQNILPAPGVWGTVEAGLLSMAAAGYAE